MARQLHVTVLVDAATVRDEDPEFVNPPEDPGTEYHVVEALRLLGHEVSILGVWDNIGTVFNMLVEQHPDVIFNLTEHYDGDRRQDKNIAAMLDMTGLPYTGAGPSGLLLCRDKRLCKQLLGLHKIRVPGFVSLPLGRRVHIPKSIRYPLVVKPAFEDSSEGISNASLVMNEEALWERTAFVQERWKQDVIAEEYIEGRELYVTLLGNRRLTAFPIRECRLPQGEEGPSLATYTVKWNHKYREKWGIEFGFADLDEATTAHVQRICKKAYKVLHLRDYGRIDVRLQPDGKLVILEANPNPDLAYGEEVAESADRAGLEYEDFIGRILHQTLLRCR